jgi:hypothetical protein
MRGVVYLKKKRKSSLIIKRDINLFSMSGLPSILLEKTLSQSSGQMMMKTYRTPEDEIVGRINNLRMKIANIKERVDVLIKESSDPVNCTITLPDINKTLKYGSSQDLERLTKYLSALSEFKLTIPDLSNAIFLNSLLGR